MAKKLKVGFDLDGVLLYNPARIIRPIISLLKQKKLVHRQELEFFVPKTKFQENMWHFFHKSSIFLAPGFYQIRELSQQGLIEPYIITARFAHLKKDFTKWLTKMGANEFLKGTYLNEKDEQPHLFKKRIIKKLDLDIFVEDNWDIVNYLNTSLNSSSYCNKVCESKQFGSVVQLKECLTQCDLISKDSNEKKSKGKKKTNKSKKKKAVKIIWVYNIFDRKIDYALKVPHLKQSLSCIKHYLNT